MNQDDGNVDQNQDPETIKDNEIIEMKRRLTLVTAEEPIPLNEDDMKHHPSIIEDIRATEGTPFSTTLYSILKYFHKLSSVVIFPVKEFLITPNPSTDEQIKDTTSEEEPFEDDPVRDEIVMKDEKDLDSEEEILSSEDIYSDEEINDYESSETSDIDDSDLLKRLDEKYGKLPQHSDTDDIDNDPTWTSK